MIMDNDFFSVAGKRKLISAAVALAIFLAGIIIGSSIASNPAIEKPTVSCISNATATPIISPNSQDKIVGLLRSAEHTIDIEVYKFTTLDIAYVLDDMRKKGVSVRVIIDNDIDPSTAKVVEYLKSRGIPLRLADYGKYVMHSKVIIIDGRVMVIGSINLSHSALNHNREAGIITDEKELVEFFMRVFEEDWKAGKVGSTTQG